MFRIRIFDGQGHLVHQIPLTTKPITIGRDPACTITIPEIGVSRNHALIEPSANFFTVKDLGSTNGTWVNKNPIKTHLLKDGDIICIGSYRIIAEQTAYSHMQEPELDRLSETSETFIDEKVFAFDKSPESGHTVFRNIDSDALPEESRNVWQRLDRLQQIARDIGLIETLEVLYQKVLEMVIAELKADRAAILIPHGSGALKPAAALSAISPSADGSSQPFDIHQGVLQTVASECTAVLIKNAGQDQRFVPAEGSRPSTVRSVMCVPLVTQKSLEGVLYLDRVKNPSPFTDEDLWFMTVIASQVSISLTNARLFQDVLTEKRRVQAIIENLQDGLVITTRDFAIEKFNHAASHLLVGKVSYLIGKNLFEVLKSKGEGFSEDLFRLAVGKGGQFPFQVKHRESLFTYTASVTPFPHTESGEVGYQFSFRDTTAFTNLELLKSEFIRIASHKLRTPLTVLLGSLELLKIAPESELPQTREYLIDGIEKNFEQLQSLVNRFVEFTELDHNLEPYKDVDLNEVLTSVWAGLASIAELKNVRLEKRVDTQEELVVPGVASRLIQCFTNILQNAIKYSPEGGIVEIDLESDKDHFRILIKDQGAGIPPEHLPFIFSGFYQAEKIPTGEIPGAGLGLTISRRILHLHQAAIQAASPATPAGKGTVITVSFPRETTHIPTTHHLREESFAPAG
ncbi:MAG: FHA domain-containing protein [Planctomycetes bacterium]|nr:FHA domain-containing protein [Planctomycetota bacterium]